MRMDLKKYFSYYSQKMMISSYYFGPPVLIDPVGITKIHLRSCVYISIDNEARKKNYPIKIPESKTVKTVSITTLGAPKFAEHLNGAISTHAM
jgi:hypothetical protein